MTADDDPLRAPPTPLGLSSTAPPSRAAKLRHRALGTWTVGSAVVAIAVVCAGFALFPAGMQLEHADEIGTTSDAPQSGTGRVPPAASEATTSAPKPVATPAPTMTPTLPAFGSD